MMGGVVSAARRRSGAIPSPISDFNWSSGIAAGGETATRTGAATYIDSSGLRQAAAANSLRFTYDGLTPNTYLGLMIEPSSTNLYLASTDLTSASWTKTGVSVVNNNGGAGFDGASSLDTVTVTGTTAQIGQQVAIPSGAVVTMSWLVKPGTGVWVGSVLLDAPGLTDSVTGWANLSTGKVSWIWNTGSKVVDPVHELVALGNGIFRYSVKARTVGITQILGRLRFVSADESGSATVGQTYRFDGAQIEVAPLPGTSFIPTTTATASRGAETISIPVGNGSYDMLIRDTGGFEWRNSVTVSGGAYALTPRNAQSHIQRVTAYAAGSLTTEQKDSITLNHGFLYRSGYTLDWADEFTDTNTARFSETGLVTSSGGGKAWKAKLPFDGRKLNNESQLYTNSTYLGINPFSVSGSILRITAGVIPQGTPNVPTNTVYVPAAPFKFYSGLLSSEIVKRWTYGVFEIRCRGEAKKGVWPAFWLFYPDGTANDKKGELDVLENIGDWPDRTALNLHEYTTSTDPDASDGSDYYFPNSSTIADWHTYAAKWEPGRVRWYVDGLLAKDLTSNWIDNADFFVMVNLALNTAAWTGADAATGAGDPNINEMPTYLDVDYIRVYKLA